ncbi:MAG: MraY family glycosyltransferase [Sphingosinicella sp.]
MNMPGTIAALVLTSLLGTAWLTGLARKYALRAEMIDPLNQRTSHRVPTPRGGGIAMVVVTIAALAIAWVSGLVASAIVTAMIGGGLLVAAIGWLDDHRHVRAFARIVVHVAAAAIVVWQLGAFPLVSIVPFWDPSWQAAAVLLTLLLLVWMVNLFNFMDGIDGIAASETAVVATAGAGLAWAAGVAVPEVLLPPLILAASALGFLWWNWPPARVFMGDVSSGFLGLALGSLTLAAGQQAPRLAAAWIALAAVFIADATVTLARRLLRGERVYEAHRSHAYQRLSRRWDSHQSVTLFTISVTLFFCFPVAYLIATGVLQPFSGVILVLVPLCIGAAAAGAGTGDD